MPASRSKALGGSARPDLLRDLASAGDIDALLRHQPHRGRPHDRASIARHLMRRGVPVDPDRVLMVSGAQHGLAATLMATLDHGDRVAVDALTYPGFKILPTPFTSS